MKGDFVVESGMHVLTINRGREWQQYQRQFSFALCLSLSLLVYTKRINGVFFFFFLFMQFLLRYCIFIVRGTNIKINVLSSPFSKWTTNLSNNLIFYIYITLSSHTITRLALPLGYTTFLVFFFFFWFD